MLVLQELRGSQLKQLLDHSAAAGGWPASGITMQVRDRKAENVLIQNKPIDEKMVYVVALSDYVANGGDYSDMLKGIPQQNIGYLLRDALIEYVRQFTSRGKPVTVADEKRITYVD
jgi:2',3'-cyclic-nucleotide 2'-phosphodiesterase (5'-nucleotidase family)